MKKFALVILIGILATETFGATEATTQNISTIISRARIKLDDCERELSIYKGVVRAADLAWETGYKANRAMERLSGTKIKDEPVEQIEPHHKICAEKAKAEMAAKSL